MKSAGTFLLAFGASLLLLFVQAWSPSLLGNAWIAIAALAFVGGFVWLFLHVVLETLGQFKSIRKKVIVFAVLLASFALTAVLSGGYAWAGIVALVLFGCLVWRGLQDFADMFRRRETQAGPENWQAVEQEQLPATSSRHSEHAKARFAHSYGVHITCTPRSGPMGLISNPLRMDE